VSKGQTAGPETRRFVTHEKLATYGGERFRRPTSGALNGWTGGSSMRCCCGQVGQRGGARPVGWATGAPRRWRALDADWRLLAEVAHSGRLRRRPTSDELGWRSRREDGRHPRSSGRSCGAAGKCPQRQQRPSIPDGAQDLILHRPPKHGRKVDGEPPGAALITLLAQGRGLVPCRARGLGAGRRSAWVDRVFTRVGAPNQTGGGAAARPSVVEGNAATDSHILAHARGPARWWCSTRMGSGRTTYDGRPFAMGGRRATAR